MMKEGHLDGVGVGSTRMFEEMNRAIEINRIQPPVDRVFAFGEVVEAFRYFALGALWGRL